MKRTGLIVMMLLLACSAFGQQGFFVGGGASYLMFTGTGEWESSDFAVTEDWFSETDWGLSWDNKNILGFAPMIGFRMNDMFAVSGSYTHNLKKTGEDDTVEVDVVYKAETEWTMTNIQVLGYLYPFRGGDLKNLYLCAGFDHVSFTLDIHMEDDNGNELNVDDEGASTGLILGGGYDIPIQDKLHLFGQATYSMTRFDDVLFSGDNEIDAEMQLGGFAVSAGLRIYFIK